MASQTEEIVRSKMHYILKMFNWACIVFATVVNGQCNEHELESVDVVRMEIRFPSVQTSMRVFIQIALRTKSSY